MVRQSVSAGALAGMLSVVCASGAVAEEEQGLPGLPLVTPYADRLVGREARVTPNVLPRPRVTLDPSVVRLKRQAREILARPPTPGRPFSRERESRRPTRLARAAQALARLSRHTEASDLNHLAHAAQSGRARWYAAPELRDAFRAIASNSTDPAIRRVAQQWVRSISQDAHLVELRREVFRLRSEGKRGVEIWAAIAGRAVDHHIDRADLSWAQKLDHVVADLGAVFNGAATRHLRAARLGVDAAPFLRTLHARRVRLAEVGEDIDPARGADMPRAFQDGTSGQVFAASYFLLVGYATTTRPESLRRAGSQNQADRTLAAIAYQIGNLLRALRDGGVQRRGLQAVPALIGAAFSNHSRDFVRPWGPDGPDYTAAVRATHLAVRKLLRSPEGPFAADLRKSLLRILAWDLTRR